MAHDENKLCPFKKGIDRKMNHKTGGIELKERFMPCAGSRCMAYRPGYKSSCARLEDANGRQK